MRRLSDRLRRRALARVVRRLRSVLDAGRRRHLADMQFFQLLSDADHHTEDTSGHARLPRLAHPL